MKKNFIYIITIVILSAAVIILLKKPVKTTDEFDTQLLRADSLQLIEITYEHNGSRILLSKGLDKWQIREPGAYEPDPNTVRTILQFATGLTLKNIISEKPEKFSKFGVDSTGIVITLRKQDNSRMSYIIGNDDKERNYSFFRLPEDNRVFLGTLFPRYRITSDVKSWRNKAISQIRPADIKALSLLSGSDVLEISRNNDSWSILKNGKEVSVGKEKIEKSLNKLSAFNASDFPSVDPFKDYAPGITLMISTVNTKHEILLLKTPESSFAFRKDKSQAFKISDEDYAVFEDLLKK